jgi:F420-dependent oxidoreductase-like protein
MLLVLRPDKPPGRTSRQDPRTAPAPASAIVGGMELRVFTEPQQGASYDDLLAVARHAERLGFAAFFRSDHYLAMGTRGLPGPTDAWTTLAGLARDTSTIRLGTLMTSATFRHPGPLAITVAGVDQMSAGRVELGIGAGWFEAEHTAYGIPFPETAERFDRLEESLAIVTGLWATPAGERFSFAGRHYRLQDSPALPKPAQSPRPPVLLGGKGRRRTPELAARFADEFNVPFESVEFSRDQFARVAEAVSAAGREATSMTCSNALVLCCGRDEPELRRRAGAIGRDLGELREHGLAGTPAEVVERIGRYGEAGASRIYLQLLDLADLDHLDLVASEVLSQV